MADAVDGGGGSNAGVCVVGAPRVLLPEGGASDGARGWAMAGASEKRPGSEPEPGLAVTGEGSEAREVRGGLA